MSEEKPSLTRADVEKFFCYLFWVVILCSVGIPAIFGKFSPLPTLTRDWVLEPVRESYPGFYKYIRVVGTGDRPYVFNLDTNRGAVHNIRTTFVPGSHWKNVTINSKDELVRGELTKSWDTGCLENAVIMRRTGIIMVGGMQVTDVEGNGHGNVDLVSCKKKHD